MELPMAVWMAFGWVMGWAFEKGSKMGSGQSELRRDLAMA